MLIIGLMMPTLCIVGVERVAVMKKLKLEEALKVLEDMKVISIPKAAEIQRKRNEAIDMAIEALNNSEIPNNSDSVYKLWKRAYEAGQRNAEPKRPTGRWIETEGLDEEIRCLMCTNHMRSDRGCDGACQYNEHVYKEIMSALERRMTEVENE